MMTPLLADDLPNSGWLHDLLLWASFGVNLALAWKLLTSKSETRIIEPQPFEVSAHDPPVSESKFKGQKETSDREMAEVKKQMASILAQFNGVNMTLAALPGQFSEQVEEKLRQRDDHFERRLEKQNEAIRVVEKEQSRMSGMFHNFRPHGKQPQG